MRRCWRSTNEGEQQALPFLEVSFLLEDLEEECHGGMVAHQVSVVGSFLGLTCCWRTTGSGNIGLVGLVLVMTLGRGCMDLMHYLLMGPALTAIGYHNVSMEL